jgi:hypothetical protein
MLNREGEGDNGCHVSCSLDHREESSNYDAPKKIIKNIQVSSKSFETCFHFEAHFLDTSCVLL